jgi:hypothetical protein
MGSYIGGGPKLYKVEISRYIYPTDNSPDSPDAETDMGVSNDPTVLILAEMRGLSMTDWFEESLEPCRFKTRFELAQGCRQT